MNMDFLHKPEYEYDLLDTFNKFIYDNHLEGLSYEDQAEMFHDRVDREKAYKDNDDFIERRRY